MTRTLRREGGFTMIELLLVCITSLIIFGASVTAWTSIYGSNRALERQQDNAEAARVALDRAARQLRNLANPTVNAIKTIDRATDYDFIFQTSDPSKTWVRYCLQDSGVASPDNAILWESESAAAVNDNMRGGLTGACPGTGWARSAAVTSGVTNTAGGIDRNVFEFECAVAAAATCPASDAEYSKIVNVGMNLWVDAVRTDRVSELNVTTGVFLRNQNEGPTAAATQANERPVAAGAAQRLGLDRPRGPHARVLLVRGHRADHRGARSDVVHGHAAGRRLAGRDVPQAVRHERRRRLGQELLPARA